VSIQIFFYALMLTSVPKIEVSERSFDFGYSIIGMEYAHNFWIYNRGDEVLNIKKLRVFCNCSVGSIAKRQIAPGDSSRFEFIFSSLGFQDERVKWGYIYSNDPQDSLIKLNITIRLYGDYSQIPFKVEPKRLNFGSLSAPNPSVTLSLKNRANQSYNLRLIEFPKALQQPNFTSTVLEPGEELELKFFVKKGIHDPELLKRSITFEAYTSTEVSRFSVPLMASN